MDSLESNVLIILTEITVALAGFLAGLFLLLILCSTMPGLLLRFVKSNQERPVHLALGSTDVGNCFSYW